MPDPGQPTGSLARSEAAFLVVIAALAASGLTEAGEPVSTYVHHFAEHGLLSRGIFLTWSTVFLGTTASGLWGVYRAIRTGSARNPALHAYVLVAIFFLGGEAWSHSFTPSVSVVVKVNSGPISLGVNVTGLVLYAWYVRSVGRRRRTRASAPEAGN